MATLYRNRDDTKRYVVHQRLSSTPRGRGEWDVDVWTYPGFDVWTFSSQVGDAFKTKVDARAWAQREGGVLTPLSAKTHPEYTSGWEPKAKRNPSRAAEIDFLSTHIIVRVGRDPVRYAVAEDSRHMKIVGPLRSTKALAWAAAKKKLLST